MALNTPRLASIVSAACLTAALVSGCGDQVGPKTEAADLNDVLAAAGEATSYRLSSFTAQKLSSSLLGVHTESEIDEDRPTVTAEVTPTGTHLKMDLSGMLEAMTGKHVDLGFEMWSTPERLTVDTRAYAALKAASPETDLGPFEPGVSYVDLKALAVGSPDLVAAIAGQGVPDLHEVAARLPEVLDNVKQEGQTITGTGKYADVQAALGADVEKTARGVAAGIALNLGVSVDDLTDLYVNYYKDTTVDVTIELDTDGSLSSIGYTVDLSGIFTRIFERPELFTPRPSDEELKSIRDMASDTDWQITVLNRFEIDDNLVIDPAPATDDDRTAQWLEFLKNAGY